MSKMASSITGCPGGDESRPKSRRPNYQRRVKPPLSYAELIAVAIKNSPQGMQTLRGIQTHMSSRYECFRGTYVGWKNSVRHNLSASDCFVKVLKNEGKPNAKDNFWTLNPNCSHYKLHQSCPLTREIKTSLPHISCASSATRKTLSSRGCRGRCKGRAVSSSSTPKGLPACESKTEQFQNHTVSAATPISATTSADEQNRTSSSLTHSQRVSNDPSSVSSIWPSLQPSVTPPVGHHDHHNQAVDEEWELLNDLFIPDSDIDLSLYNNNSCQPEYFHHGQAKISQDVTELKTPPFTGRPSFLLADNIVPKTEVQSSNEVVAHQVKLRQKTERPTARRHHPYQNHQMFGSFRRYEHCRYEWHSAEPKGSEDSRRVPSSSFGNGYMVISAIRSSLGLDLDEMALYAIEDSVRVLDMSRPCDFMSA